MSTQINQEQRINIASLEPECWSIIMSIGNTFIQNRT